jgi:hypothetical protein
MKFNILLGLVVLALGYITCKNLQKTPSAPITATPAPVEQGSGPVGWKAAHVGGEHADTAGIMEVYTAPAMVKVPIEKISPASASRKAYLSTGWWHLSMAFQGINSKVHENYQQKWMRFREDQTFDVMIKGKVIESGKWAWDEPNHQIYLVCSDPYINNTWVVTDKGFVMIWTGNTDLNITGIQVRVVCSKGEPKWSEM